MDYYSYEPMMTLDRPVALAGFFGMELGVVAGVVSQRTGLPVIELDRWIEHEAGKSVSEIVLREGVNALKKRELPLLQRALKDTPPPLLVLGDSTLTDYDPRKLLMNHAHIIYFQAALPDLLARVQRGLSSSPGCYWPWMLRAPTSVQEIETYFADRRGGYESAHTTVDVTGWNAGKIAERLLTELQRLN